MPVAADECVRSLADARRLRALDAADAIVLKQQPLGGVRAALDHRRRGRGTRDRLVDDGDVDRHRRRVVALAAALPELRYACGLATLSQIDGDVVRDPLVPEHGVVARAHGHAGCRAARALPGGEQLTDDVRSLEVARVAGAIDDLDARVAGSLHAMRCAMSTYFGSSPPAISSTGIRSSPSRGQLSGCVPCPSARSWCVRRSTVFAARRSSIPARARGERREQRLRQPAFEERIHTVTLDLSRQRLVTLASSGALGVVGDSRRRADRARGRSTQVGPIERELEAQAPAHRVSDVGRATRRRRPTRARSTTKSRSSGTRSATASSSGIASHDALALRESVHQRVRHPRILP